MGTFPVLYQPVGRSSSIAIQKSRSSCNPANADTLRKNPLGLYVDAVDWSRELDAQNPAPPAPRPTAPPSPMPSVPLGSPLDPTLAQPQPETRP